MDKIRAIVIDDEQSARDVLTTLLDFSSYQVEIVESCADFLVGVEAIKKHKPDVVFLDIQMPNYAGYEISNFIDPILFKIIFVTAYDKYALKAFELNAIDYLLKPIDRLKLDDALKRLYESIEVERKMSDYKNLLAALNKEKDETLTLSESGKTHVIQYNDLIAFNASGAYCNVYINNYETLTVSKNLRHYEKLLEDSSEFIRIHRAWIVNKNYIRFISKSKKEVSLENNILAKISRNKIHELENALR